jgi:hypothetical protein
MASAPRASLVFAMLLCAAFSARAAAAPPIERGTAIIDPAALRELDHGRFALARIMAPQRADDTPLSNRELFSLPSMLPVRQALDSDFERYIGKHKVELPNENIGVGSDYAFQLFDRTQLYSADTRFVLSGIVNRMDRAYVLDRNCGEIRLIYRLTETNAQAIGEAAVTLRLPMTLNVVLKAKAASAATACAEIARRWLDAGKLNATGTALANRLTAAGGALASLGPENIDRIETNLQIAHAPKSATQDFRTDYLMEVFDYDATAKAFEEAPMEDQIDRDRLLSDTALARDFRAFILDPAHFAELDRGTLVIPDRFLLRSAIAPTPVGFARPELQPAFGLVAGEDNAGRAVFSKEDIVVALARAAASDTSLQNIKSVAGFERRLNDITCTGCHQTRGIGGFHFPGVDWMAAKPSNSTIVPASPHFFGDQVRRRDILTALADGKVPDFSRGFSSRPQLRGSTELAGTEYEDGWGAHCYVSHENAIEDDKSFQGWTCAAGLTCQAINPATRVGMCFVKTR